MRIDQWLWAVRITKTRSDAAGACRAGHVKVNGKTAKPSTAVKVGDRVEALIHRRERVLEPVGLIIKRVGASTAVEQYRDFSPEPVPRTELPPLFERDPGSGRPTKRDRRQLDRLRGRERRG